MACRIRRTQDLAGRLQLLRRLSGVVSRSLVWVYGREHRVLSHREKGLGRVEWLSETFWVAEYVQSPGTEWRSVVDFVPEVVNSSGFHPVLYGHLLCVNARNQALVRVVILSGWAQSSYCLWMRGAESEYCLGLHCSVRSMKLAAPSSGPLDLDMGVADSCRQWAAEDMCTARRGYRWRSYPQR